MYKDSELIRCDYIHKIKIRTFGEKFKKKFLKIFNMDFCNYSLKCF